MVYRNLMGQGEDQHQVLFSTRPKGKHAKQVDRALPGKHTKKIYDKLNHAQASVLAQMRTGHSTLHSFLAKIKKTTSETCDCSLAPETVTHFLFYCPKWDHLRDGIRDKMGSQFGNISLALRGIESEEKTMEECISFALATKRFQLFKKKKKKKRTKRYETLYQQIPVISHTKFNLAQEATCSLRPRKAPKLVTSLWWLA